MEVIRRRNAEDVAEAAFGILRDRLKRPPPPVIGLAAGRTPLGLYRKMRESGLDFRPVRFFNLDEFEGLGPADPQSFHHHLWKDLLGGLSLDPGNVELFRGDVPDSGAACARIEERIRNAGGIDVQILGVGRNGHLAFNEPGTPLDSRTRVVTLSPQTLADQEPGVPRTALTLGLGTILEARCLVAMATGAGKADAVRMIVEGAPEAQCPAAVLRRHPCSHLLIDGEAGRELGR